MVMELNSSDQVTDKYIRGSQLIKSDINGYYLYNAHGDVIQLTDPQGTITTSYLYDAFGIEQSQQINDPNPFRYCGEYLDKESGNVYLRARYYDPENGRFISEDPFRDGWNWYVYCNNNPVMFIDPSGLEFIALRPVIEELGGRVDWDENANVATVSLDGKSVEVYAGDDNGSYIKNNRLYTDDTGLFAALATSFSLGKGWKGRIETHGSGAGFQKHVVVTDKYGNEYAQNKDGSPHHKGGGEPPNSIKKKLKELKNWDWDKNEKEWFKRIKISYDTEGHTFIKYPNGRIVTVYQSLPYYLMLYKPSNQDLRKYSYGPTYIDLSGGNMETNQNMPFLPMPNPVAVPVPTPIPVPVLPI